MSESDELKGLRADLGELRAKNAELAKLELITLRDLDAARAEIAELRTALIAMCDTYSANRTEKLKVKAIRAVANKGATFSLDAVDAEIARLDQQGKG